ncbi:MAG: flagellar export chaperone FliS [Lachnospiraceae bacterium]
MTRECKQQFTLRITQANKTELIVILYEMLLTYTADAKKSLQDGKTAEYREDVRKAERCLSELIDSLDLSYEIGLRLLSLYLYCNRELLKADIRKDEEFLLHVEAVITKLHDAYKEVAAQDDSAPVMENSQTVYAGFTYGKNSLTENVADQGANRGFRA